jgi:hypothetical protein
MKAKTGSRNQKWRMNKMDLNKSTGACGLALGCFLIANLADSTVVVIMAGGACGALLLLSGYYFFRAVINAHKQ